MKKIFFFLLLLLMAENIYGEAPFFIEKDTLALTKSAQSTNIDFYFNSSFSAYKTRIAPASTGFRLEDARIYLYGNYNKDLSYNVRFRLNRPFTPSSQDNASVALDMAFLTYRFGKDRQWDLRLGKAYAMIGSYEIDIHPLYEYIYGDYFSYIVNPFLTVLQLDYMVNEHHKVGIQGHNTLNAKFSDHLESNGFISGDYLPSKAPIGGYIYWSGSFFDGALHTNYSYNVSQFAQDYYTHTFSLGHQLKIGKNSAYLDLMYSHMGADYALVASNILNIYEGRPDKVMYKNIVYKGIISRYEYQFDDHWSTSAKLAVEFAGSKNLLSEHFRQNYSYFLAIQYEPLKTQDFRFYGAYVGNTINYAEALNRPYEQFHKIAIGAAYTLPILKKHSAL